MNESAPLHELLTKEEVAEYLRIDVRTLDRYIKRQEIAVIRLDRTILIKREDLMKFIESRYIPATGAGELDESEASE